MKYRHRREGEGGAAGHLGGPSEQSLATTVTDTGTEFGSARTDESSLAEGDVWRGDEGDWGRCLALLKKHSRDSSKLDLWERWVGASRRENGLSGEERQDQGKGKQKAENGTPAPVGSRQSSPDSRNDEQRREYIEACLKVHLTDAVYLFIYPASRAQFIRLLIDRGYKAVLEGNDGAYISTGFWSQSQGLISLLSEEDSQES